MIHIIFFYVQLIKILIFQYDEDHDGFLSVHEMVNLVKHRPAECTDLPKTVAKNLIKMHDENNDGKLNFDEFYKLSQEHSWVRDICIKYCKLIIPPRECVNKGKNCYFKAFTIFLISAYIK